MALNKEVLLEIKDKIATVTLNRPEVLNAFDGGIRDGLQAAAEQILSDIDVRVAILTGAGDRSFCAGIDLKKAASGTEVFGIWANKVRSEFEGNQILRNLFTMYDTLPVPVIAAINGYCLGMGFELALACDIRIASETSVFSIPEVTIGTTPDCGGTQRLPRIVGMGKAKELIYTGRRIDAAEALRIGLVEHVYPKDKLMEEARKLAQEIAAIAPPLIQGCKRAINAAMSYPMDIGLNYETSMAVMTRQNIGQGASARLKEVKS
jgi:enoyl-CoA hydratase/carnithine racemase